MNAAPARWGTAATIAWTLLALGIVVAVQTAFAFAYAMGTMRSTSPEELGRRLEALASNGDIVSVGTILSSAACLLLLIGVVKLKRGATLADYFPFDMPAPRMIARWVVIALALIAAYDLACLAVGRPIVPDFSRSVWATAGDRTTLVAAIVVVAPVFEEILFRGFLLAGLVASRLGEFGAVLLSSVAWAVIHLQYDIYGAAFIVGVGFLLGYARLRTGSLAVPIILHMLVNAVSTIETVLIPK